MIFSNEDKTRALDLIFKRISGASGAQNINNSRLREILMKAQDSMCLSKGIQCVKNTQKSRCYLGNGVYISRADCLSILETYQTLLGNPFSRIATSQRDTVYVPSTEVLEEGRVTNREQTVYILAKEVDEEVMAVGDQD